jgi:transketolase
VKEIKGAKLTIATAGPLLSNVAEACSNLPVNVIYFHTIKPLDKDLLKRFNDTDFIVIHDAYGLFEAINAASRVKVSYHGLPDDFCCYYGTLADVRRKMGLDTAGIRRYIENILIKG